MFGWSFCDIWNIWRCPKGYPKSSIFVGYKTSFKTLQRGSIGDPHDYGKPPCFKVKKDLLHPPARYQPGKRGKSPVIHGNFGTASPPGMKSAASLHQEITSSPGMTRIHENSGSKGCANSGASEFISTVESQLLTSQLPWSAHQTLWMPQNHHPSAVEWCGPRSWDMSPRQAAHVCWGREDPMLFI